MPSKRLGDEIPIQLLTWASPTFPVGSFAYSHGLEWLIDSGSIQTAEALEIWVADLLERGSGWNDAVLFAEAYGAADYEARLLAARDLAAAMAPSSERHLEAVAQGRAFLQAIEVAWPCRSARRLLESGDATYPVAMAAAAADHGVGLRAALLAYLHAFVANLVSVGVRLVPLGQTAGLQVLAALHPLIAATADRALASTLDDLGSATFLSDIASMRHEQQYSRVFRT